MPGPNEPSVKLSAQIADAREKLLTRFQSQIQTTHEGQLEPFDSWDEGEPFINLDSNPPQIKAIKQVINALYHAEQAVKQWEEIDTSTYSGKAYAVKQGVSACLSVYNSLALLNDATPEIQSLVSRNYSLLEPVFTNVYGLIQQNGWESQFQSMDVVGSANTIIDKGASSVGKTVDGSDPISTFSENLNQLLEQVVKYQNASTDKEAQKKELDNLMKQLETSPITQGLSLKSVEESSAVSSLMSWLKTLKESDFELNETTINQYLTWANQSMSGLVLFTDSLERTNYLKAGSLSDPLCQNMDKFSEQVNRHIESSHLEGLSTVKMSSQFVSVREEAILQDQKTSVQNLNKAESSRTSVEKFFSLLNKYKDRSLDDLPESTRGRLRALYPQVQEAIAHVDLDLDKRLVEVLNKTGPDKLPTQGYASWGIGYLSSFVVNNEITKILTKQEKVDSYLAAQISSEKYKLYVAESSRAKLDGNPGKLSIYDRVDARVEDIRSKMDPPTPSAKESKELVAFKSSSLKNLRGNFAYIQELGLSKTVHGLLDNVSTLIKKNLNEKDQALFTKLPHTIDSKEPDYIKQLKSIENALFNLEVALSTFENLDRNQSYWQITKSLYSLGKAAMEVKSSIALVSPAVKQTLGPVLERVGKVGATISSLNGQVDNKKALSSLQDQQVVIVEKTLLTTEQITELHNNRKEAFNELLEVEHRQSAAKQLFETLGRYAEQGFTDITADDLANLRTNFSQIQAECNRSNLDMSNEFARVLNHLETKGPSRLATAIQPKDVLALQTKLDTLLQKQHKIAEINVTIANEQLTQAGIGAAHLLTDEAVLQERTSLKSSFAEELESREQVEPGELRIAPNLAKDIADARTNVLNLFQAKLSPVLAQQLMPNPNPKEIPFVINVDNEPPQLLAIKRVVNAMYHAEQAARKWSQMEYNPNSVIDQARMLEQGVHLVSDLSNAINCVRDAGPEVQELLKDNYDLIAPMMDGATKWMKNTIWKSVSFGSEGGEVQQFASMLERGANAFMGGKINGDDPITSFSNNLNDLLKQVVKYQNASVDKEAQKEELNKLMKQLETNPLTQGVSIKSIEESRAVSSLISWLKTLKESDFELNETTINQYVTWVNQSMSGVILFTDNLERTNYLKSGALSDQLCQGIDEFSTQVNRHIESSHLEGLTTVKMSSQFASVRENAIYQDQIAYVQNLNKAENNRDAVGKFFDLLDEYKGRTLDDIPEQARVKLRSLYPQIQEAIANVDLDLDKRLVDVLNKTGPEKLPGLVSNNEVSRILTKREDVNSFITSQINSEKYKLYVAEESRAKLDGNPSKSNLYERTDARIKEIRGNIAPSTTPVDAPKELVAFKSSNLNNLRGNIAYLQELGLSKAVHGLLDNASTLIRKNLNQKDQALFKNPPHAIDSKEPDYIKQLKSIENALFNLEAALSTLEKLDGNQSTWQLTNSVITLGKAALEVKQSVTILSPAVSQTLGPILERVGKVGETLSALKGQSDNKTALSSLQDQQVVSVEKAPITPEQITKLHNNRKEAFNELLEVEHRQSAAKQFFETLERHRGQLFSEIPDEDLATLRTNFSQIQAECNQLNLDISNEFARILNHLESKDLSEPFVTIIQPGTVLALQNKLEPYLQKQHRIAEINVEIANEQLTQAGIGAANLLTDEAVLEERASLIASFTEDLESRAQVKPGELSIAPNLPKDIADARANVLNLFQSKLSPALARQLVANPNPKEIPFVINVDNEPPQVLAMKRLVNAMYHAEQAAREWNQMEYNPHSVIDQARMLNQGVQVVRHLSNAVSCVRDAGPEVQDLLKDNYDLIAPMMKGASSWMDGSIWKKLPLGSEGSKIQKFSSMLGLGVNAFSPGESGKGFSTTQTLVSFLTGVPQFMNNISGMLDKRALNENPVEFSDASLKGMNAVFELYLHDKKSFSNYLNAGNGILGLIKLYKLYSQEKALFNATGAAQYKAFLENNYVNVLSFLEEVEVKNYLKPGTLTTPFVEQIEKLTEKMHANFKSEKDKEPMFKVPKYPPEQHLGNLKQLRTSYLEKIASVSLGAESVGKFSEVLKPYEGGSKTLADLPAEQLMILRQNLFRFQDSLAVVDVNLTNKLITQLNELKSTGEIKSGTPLSISELQGLRGKLDSQLQKEKAFAELQVKVVNEAIKGLGDDPQNIQNVQSIQNIMNALDINLIEQELEKIRDEKQRTEVLPTDGMLILGSVSPIDSLVSYLPTTHGVALSERLDQLSKQFDSTIKNSMSDKVIQKLGQPDKDGIYAIQPNSPTVVKEIQLLENAFIRMKNSLLVLEGMRKDGNLFAQATALVALAQDARELSNEFSKMSPEVQQQCKSISAKVQAMCSFVSSLQGKTDEQESYIEPEIPEPEQPKTEVQTRGSYETMSEYMRMATEKMDKYISYLDYAYAPPPKQGSLLSVYSESAYASENFKEASKLNELIIQFSELLLQMKKAGETANKKITTQLLLLKESAYTETLAELSKMEDELCLKPGTLLDQGLDGINDMFKGVSLELDNLPFEIKLDLNDQGKYLSLLIDKTNEEVKGIKESLKQSPNDKELLFKLEIKEDKLNHLQSRLQKLPTPEQHKSDLLDSQFKVLHARAKSDYTFGSFLVYEYEDAFKKVCADNKANLMRMKEYNIDSELGKMLGKFQHENNANYFLVDKTISKLWKFYKTLDRDNYELKNYINDKVQLLKGIDSKGMETGQSIEERAKIVNSLVDDEEFKSKVCSVKEGSSLLNKLKSLVQTVKYVINNGITSFSQIAHKYNEFKIEGIVGKRISDAGIQDDEPLQVKHDKEAEQNIVTTKTYKKALTDSREESTAKKLPQPEPETIPPHP